MPVYTCYDMIPDCQRGKIEGWQFLVARFVPPLRRMAHHYRGSESHVRRLLQDLADSRLSGWQAMPEREFLYNLRDPLLQVIEYRANRAGVLDADFISEVFEPLTAIERQLAWFEVLEYNTDQAAFFFRMSAENAAAIQNKARELLRARMDDWTRTALHDNAANLTESVRARKPESPVAAKVYFDWIDGRLTWRARQETEAKVIESWYELDALCRVREADEFLRGIEPLPPDEVAEHLKSLGFEPKPSKGGLFRWLAKA